jgi:hypothetical protein
MACAQLLLQPFAADANPRLAKPQRAVRARHRQTPGTEVERLDLILEVSILLHSPVGHPPDANPRFGQRSGQLQAVSGKGKGRHRFVGVELANQPTSGHVKQIDCVLTRFRSRPATDRSDLPVRGQSDCAHQALVARPNRRPQHAHEPKLRQ